VSLNVSVKLHASYEYIFIVGQSGFILKGKCVYSMKMPGQLESAQMICIMIIVMEISGKLASCILTAPIESPKYTKVI
jgi:hypothetical protein